MIRASRTYKDYLHNLRERQGKRFFLSLKVAGNELSAGWFANEPALVGPNPDPESDIWSSHMPVTPPFADVGTA
jgi:hypothetical protein